VRKDSGRTCFESVETLNSRSCKRVTRFTGDVSRAMAAQAEDDLKAQVKSALPEYSVAADQTYASSASATSQS
jgi:division protein CdvB (Snf7/Vps24/ESCRT-III family)